MAVPQAPLIGPAGAQALADAVAVANRSCLVVPATRPVVFLPSLQGPRDGTNLTALLALWLAREGVPVVVHGPLTCVRGTSTAQVLHDLGLPLALNAGDIDARWARREPAFMPTDVLCPPLALSLAAEGPEADAARPLAVQVARLLAPVAGAPALRIVPQALECPSSQLAGWAKLARADLMLVATAGDEPVADARHQPRIEVWLGGLRCPDLGAGAAAGPPASWPLLPRDTGATATAVYVQDVLSGERPVPPPLLRQAQLIEQALQRMRARGESQPAVSCL